MKRVPVKKKDALPKISRKYTPLKMIGRGSFGVVFLVRRQADSRQCVMKLVDMSMLSEKDRADAKTECEVLQRLRRHPHIIRMYEHYTEEDGKLAIVMEYADGGDLSQRIDMQKQAGGAGFGAEQVLDWFVQICLALKHAHDRKVRACRARAPAGGARAVRARRSPCAVRRPALSTPRRRARRAAQVMHRDLKPQNIFLTRENYVRLGDFGISKVLGSTLSVAHTCVGTPLYLAPELCEGKEYNNRCAARSGARAERGWGACPPAALRRSCAARAAQCVLGWARGARAWAARSSRAESACSAHTAASLSPGASPSPARTAPQLRRVVARRDSV